MERPGLYNAAIAKLGPEAIQAANGEGLSPEQKNVHFAMHCNGFAMRNGTWEYDNTVRGEFIPLFKGQDTAFFGPNAQSQFYYGSANKADHFHEAFKQDQVIKAIEKYRDGDDDEAARIAYILGGIIRHYSSRNISSPYLTIGDVRYVADMTRLGVKGSGDAVASAMAMYVLSNKAYQKDRKFNGEVYHMAEAIAEDPTDVKITVDMGVSQVDRLHSFLAKKSRIKNIAHPTEEISDYMKFLDILPTVGAEFHFLPEAFEQDDNFWQKLAILNMSQYQRGSYIQMSRNDYGVIEVRMNPSVYPVTIANWQHMIEVLPELKQAYFTATVNRKGRDGDFSWEDERDKALLEAVRGIGLVSYVAKFESVEDAQRAQIGFGSVYLGQTVRLNEGQYDFTGHWSDNEKSFGQFSVYAGYGNNMYDLMYYLSMVMAKPDILSPFDKERLCGVQTLEDALSLDHDEVTEILGTIQDSVQNDPELDLVTEASNEIIATLKPE